MRDMPVFTTEFGVASLILKEVPYRQEGYIRVLDVQPGQLAELIDECAGFCRAVGAERVYATGHEGLESYPLFTAVYEMRGTAWVDREKLSNLFPVTEQTVRQWRNLLNERMRNTDNAATLEMRDEKRILESGGAYFVHEGGKPLGLGWLEGEELLTVASLEPGAGEKVMHSMMSLVEGASVTLQVASTNTRAIRLYEKLGFITTRECSRWYRVK
jgi:hypothetical protein